MDRHVRLGLAAQRRLFELAREVAGDRLDVANALIERLREERVVRLDQGAFLEFDDRAARACVRTFLGARQDDFKLARDLVPPESERLLRLWEQVDLPMPLRMAWRSRPEWLEQLLLRGLVREGARGLRMSMRLRLHLWLTDERLGPAERSPGDPVFQVLRALRREGRWHEAALWAIELEESWPGVLEELQSVPITIALGLAQSQHFERLHQWFEKLEGEGRLNPIFTRRGWGPRIRAVRAFSDIERGDPRPPAFSREARFWFTLVRCWSHVYAGSYRRALRMLDFLQRARLPRYSWVDPILASWKATAYHYLEQYADSRDWNRRAIRLAVESGWQERQMTLMRNLAAALLEGGEIDAAIAILRGLERRHMLDHRWSLLPGVYNLLAHLMDIRVRLGEGAWTNRRAQHFSLRIGSAFQYLAFVQGQAIRAMRSSHLDLAEAKFEEVESLAANVGHPLVRANANWNLARLVWRRGAHKTALEMLDRAEAQFVAMRQHTRAADMKCDRAIEFLELGQFDRAKHEIKSAHSLYSACGWPREAALLEPLGLELSMRSAPDSVTESNLDGIRSSVQDTRTIRAYSYAIVALGFALLDDELTSSTYGKDTLAEVNRLQDPFMVRHILNLGESLITRSRTVEDLVSFWTGTFPFQAK